MAFDTVERGVYQDGTLLAIAETPETARQLADLLEKLRMVEETMSSFEKRPTDSPDVRGAVAVHVDLVRGAFRDLVGEAAS